ncbi:MAG: glycerol-3-phosphate acyltransferase [Acidimicrobiales bacterium]
MLGISFLVGSVPFSGLAARLLADVDLRDRGSGTVSGTGLYEVAGFGPLAVAGSLEVAVGALGPLLAGRDRPFLGAASSGLAVAGHNWSPFLSGAGGRGISTVLGATLPLAPEGTVVMGAGLGLGRLAHRTALGCFVGLVVMLIVLARRRGLVGAFSALCLITPVLVKRLLGNRPPESWGSSRLLVNRLIFDSDL